MSRAATPQWTLDELTARVGDALAVGYQGQRNGQVTDVPNLRTIRYYTTLGLLDRPSEMRGRTAYYSPRHLQQLVAIKRLQADGLTLQQVQERLAGITRARLAELAQLPTELPSPAQKAHSRRDGAFWAEDSPPAPVTAAPPVQLVTLPLHSDVSLSITASRAPSPEDVAAIRLAAQALLDELKKRGLLSKEEP